MKEVFAFHFEGQALDAYLENGFITNVFLCNEYIEINLTNYIIKSFFCQQSPFLCSIHIEFLDLGRG